MASSELLHGHCQFERPDFIRAYREANGLAAELNRRLFAFQKIAFHRRREVRVEVNLDVFLCSVTLHQADDSLVAILRLFERFQRQVPKCQKM